MAFSCVSIAEYCFAFIPLGRGVCCWGGGQFSFSKSKHYLLCSVVDDDDDGSYTLLLSFYRRF